MKLSALHLLLRIQCFFLVFALPLSAASRNYYLSAAGNDRANGRSPSTAWRTLDRLTPVRLHAGDTVFLERGHRYSGSIHIASSGTPQQPIVITAYGQGAAPVLLGSVAISQWQAVDGRKFRANVPQQVFDLFIQGKRLTPARFPNQGYLTIEEGFGKDSIACSQLTQPAGFFDGALLRVRPIDWVYETRTVYRYQPGLLMQGPQSRYLIEPGFAERTQNGKIPVYAYRKGYGFFLEGLSSFVDTAGEWNWQRGLLELQWQDGSEPPREAVQAVIHAYGIWIEQGRKHVVVSGLHFEAYEKGGIGGGANLSGIRIADNVFHNIHGCGVWLDSAATNTVLTRNRFSDILGRGISALEPVAMEISDNVLQRIGLARGYGWTGVNGASAIVLHNNERAVQTDTTLASYCVVRNNRVDSCGYNGIRVDGHHNLVEHNIVDHCSLTLNDGANIYCFGKGPGATHHSVFRNNIVRYSVGDSEATPGNPNLAFGIYLDNNSTNMLVEGNTVIATGAAGIVNNDASHTNVIRNNTVFDCKEGIGFAEWANKGHLHSMVVENNTVIGVKPGQKLAIITNWLAPSLNPGLLRNNRYLHTATTKAFQYNSKQVPDNSRLELSFEQWAALTANDRGSTMVSPLADWLRNREAVVLVNDGSAAQSFLLPEGSLLADGAPAPATVVLQPFQSLVYLKTRGSGITKTE